MPFSISLTVDFKNPRHGGEDFLMRSTRSYHSEHSFDGRLVPITNNP